MDSDNSASSTYQTLGSFIGLMVFYNKFIPWQDINLITLRKNLRRYHFQSIFSSGMGHGYSLVVP